MAAERHELCAQFFAELERHGIPYAILDGSAAIPHPPRQDIDYAVPDRDLGRIREIVRGVARSCGWVVVQSIEHEVNATYTVIADPERPEQRIALDVRSHFTQGPRCLVSDTILLRDRNRREDGYVVASPAAECVYRLAKAVSTSAEARDHLERVRDLVRAAPGPCEAAFTEVFGDTGRSLEDWIVDSFTQLGALRRHLHARHPARARLGLREAARLTRRALHPPGIHLAVLGPDGAGKTTLLEDLSDAARPAFSSFRVYKFRPDVLHRIGNPSDPEPHARAPRCVLASWAKVLYYFGDSLLGWMLIVRPAMARNSCIAYDRSFDDLLVDQRRYLVRGSWWLVRLLRPLLPRPNLTFILDASTGAIRDRKPELSVAALEEQRAAYQRLASGSATYRLLATDQPREVVAHDAWRHVLMVRAARHYPDSRAKRLFDAVAATAAVIALSPVLLGVALAVRVNLGSPVLFRQQRPGRGGVPFRILKFRTMRNLTLPSGRMRPDAERMTPFGSMLRRTSLDELPELINVIKGDMSLVGPRPLLMEYLPRYSAEQSRRHEVRPGITGWAQIHGRNAVGWQERLAMDVWYVDHRSFWLDLRILLATALKVLRREGITVAGSGAETRFLGVESGDKESQG